MIFLAADTSGKDGSLALARGEGRSLEILEVLALEGGNFSAQLVPQIAGLLAKHGFSRGDVGGFAVVTGPGSFTGLRVGLAAVKGLAEALGKPIATVSKLEIIALASGLQGFVIAALDAGRKQAFVGEYEIAGDAATCVKEHLLTWEELAAHAAARVVATPDRLVADGVSGAGGKILLLEASRADAVARIGWVRFLAGDLADVALLEANYIRRTDAEILVLQNALQSAQKGGQKTG